MSHYWTADDHPAVRQAQIEDWLEDLCEFGVELVRFACADWRRSQTRRPTPADIRLLAIAEHRRRNPTPDPPYIPPPAPRERTPEDIAHVGRMMALWRSQVDLSADALLTPEAKRAKHDDPEALRRGRVELGLED